MAAARPSPAIVELSWAGHREGSVAHALGFTRLPGSFFIFLTCIIVAYLVLIEVAKAHYLASSQRQDRPPRRSAVASLQLARPADPTEPHTVSN
jgi:hypothetical protein